MIAVCPMVYVLYALVPIAGLVLLFRALIWPRVSQATRDRIMGWEDLDRDGFED